MIGDAIKEVKLELFEKQNEIIHLQSEAISELIAMLQQHSDVKEADLAGIKYKIDRAADIRKETGI